MVRSVPSGFSTVLAAALVVAGVGASARADYLENSLGNWAIGNAGNCRVPAKAYTLTTYNGNIIWRTQTGDTDIETIISGNDDAFRTVTVNSMHRSGGYPRGTSWTYTNIGPDRMQVRVGNGSTFVLERCR